MRTILVIGVLVLLLNSTVQATELFVRYRLEQWQTRSYVQAVTALEVVNKLTARGVEVQQTIEPKQTVVKYRCPSWRFVEVDNIDAAAQWKAWFKDLGFEVNIGGE